MSGRKGKKIINKMCDK